MNMMSVALGIAIPFLTVIVFALRQEEHCGPMPEAFVSDCMNQRVRWRYGVAIAVSATAGFALVTADLALVTLVAAVLLGFVASQPLAVLRLKGIVIESAGPPPDVPDESLFPSDNLARLLSSGHLPVLPLWLDLVVISFSEGLGIFLALLIAATTLA